LIVTPPLLQHKNCWIFDMDGTLTLAVHDFDAIRTELKLPPGLPILEALAALPVQEAAPLRQRLNAIELELARQAQAAPGANELLAHLSGCGFQLGILTRNSRQNIEVTLDAAGLAHHFSPATRISRDCTRPKPHPDGIHLLLERWHGTAAQAVMVGDHLHDLLTAKAAGVTGIYIDPEEAYPFQAQADLSFASLGALMQGLPGLNGTTDNGAETRR